MRFVQSIDALLFIKSEYKLGKRNEPTVKLPGGPDVTDANGILYSADTLSEGITSDHGKRHSFGEVPDSDKAIYQVICYFLVPIHQNIVDRWRKTHYFPQTERYSLSSFTYSYKIPTTNSEYTILLRFSEVYFERPKSKVR